jgi:hypothetical protein
MMKRLHAFAGAGLFALWVSVPLGASAATFSSPGLQFTTSPTGTITLKTPSSFGASVTCRIQLTGGVRLDGSAADIQYVRFSGTEPLCQRIQMNNGATWKLTPTTLTTGDLSNVGFVITALLPIIPASNCGPATISVGLVNGPGVVNVSALNMYLPGSCAVASLNVAIPATSIIP